MASKSVSCKYCGEPTYSSGLHKSEDASRKCTAARMQSGANRIEETRRASSGITTVAMAKAVEDAVVAYEGAIADGKQLARDDAFRLMRAQIALGNLLTRLYPEMTKLSDAQPDHEKAMRLLGVICVEAMQTHWDAVTEICGDIRVEFPGGAPRATFQPKPEKE